MTKKYYLQATSPLGKRIRITKSYWNYIIQKKHASVVNKEKFVLQTVSNPDIIRVSQKDKTVWLFYRKADRKYFCVVVKVLNSEGFIVTVYFTDKIKRGEIVWQK